MSTTPFIIVTGASRGIGRACVSSLVNEHGAHVLAIARDQSALAALSAAHGTGVETLALDLADADAPERVAEVVGARRVHGLLNNAGTLLKLPLGAYGADSLQALFATNVYAPLLITQALRANLGSNPPGHMVSMASMGGFQDSAKFPGLAAYSASKAALACMAQCLAEELKEEGIRSNCLAVGAVATEMLGAAFPGYTAPVSAEAMGSYVARFVLEGHKLYNGKVLPVAVSTP